MRRRHGYPGGRAPFAHGAFLYTLIPVNAESPLRHSAREKGDQGVFWNSCFGEIWDCLVCDAGQDHAAFSAALAHYPVAFLVGRGKIVTCAVERCLPDILRNWKPRDPGKNGKKGAEEAPSEWGEAVSGHVDFPLVRELLTKVTGGTAFVEF